MKKIPVECWSRVVGYFRPESSTNPGKRAEMNDRTVIDSKTFRPRTKEERKLRRNGENTL